MTFNEVLEETKKELKEKVPNFDQETWDNVEIATTALFEAVRQLTETAKNVNKIVQDYDDKLMHIPFGIVSCITLGGRPILTQVHGRSGEISIALSELAKVYQK